MWNGQRHGTLASGSAGRNPVRAISMEHAVEAGILKRGERGDLPFDRFRSRLMIPIHDSVGNVIAFGGRGLTAAATPKYLNSAESMVFSKGRTLFAFHLARAAIRKQGEAIVVEGYMDAIALHAVGIHNAVASLGTALTLAQLELAASPMRFLTRRKLVLALDADEAGRKATFRLYEAGILAQLGAKGVDVCMATLPSPYKDPDEYIQAMRASASEHPAVDIARSTFQKQVVDEAIPWIEWVGRQLILPYTSTGRPRKRSPNGNT